MRAAYRSSTYLARGSLRSRAASVALAGAVALLIVLALLRLGGVIHRLPGDGRILSTFDVAADAQRERAASRTVTRHTQQAARRAAPRTPQRDEPPPPSPAPPLPPPPLHLPGVLVLSGAEFASSDIARLPRGARTGADKGQAAEGDSAAAYGPGAGPGGERLYEAEWVREPTSAETAPYMPAGRAGWGMVACQTAPGFRVENCRELDETPGSGIARGLRQAAWQFKVRPPRVGGRPLIGAWVRIKFDLVEGPVK